MHNFWLIARHEYRKIVNRKGFLISMIGIPLLIVVIIGVSIVVNVANTDNRPVGYVDAAGVIISEQDSKADIKMIAYPDEASAQLALQAQDIQAYYILPAGYPHIKEAELVYWTDAPSTDTREAFTRFIRQNLASTMPPAIQTRLIEGSHLTVRSMDGRREIGDSSFISFILPFFASFLFIFVVMSSAGYLLQVVADEKENRTVEILLTSLSPEQLIGGKAVGLMAVALTQIVVWLSTIIISLLVAGQFLDWARITGVPWDFIGIIILFFIPSFALIAGIMTAIGGSVSELRQGQQIAGILNMLFILPLFFLAVIMTSPNSPLVMFMTFFPTTSFVTIGLRWGMDFVPVWQLILSWLLLVTSAVLSVWASARIFRAGMLRYGQRLDMSMIFAALRRSKNMAER
jgi:ABC-2 type transport system permease protein